MPTIDKKAGGCGVRMRVFGLVLLVHMVRGVVHQGGILYPKESETRQVKSLDGLWNFVIPDTKKPFEGFDNFWYKSSLTTLTDKEVQLMPVPSSYNDLTTDPKIRDHVGLVWYDRKFFVPKDWAEAGRTWIRFDSVSYAAQVWINGQLAMSHEIGHLPFHTEITNLLKFGEENLVTVACDNTLLADTIPQGKVGELETGRLIQTYTFDFFNYAGIHRPVRLYTTPKSYIDDIAIRTYIKDNKAWLDYNITGAVVEAVSCRVTLTDKNNNLVGKNAESNVHGTLVIENPNLWWPYLMHPQPGYMYNLNVELIDASGQLVDKYIQKIGLRSVKWTNSSLLINDKPVYLHGFGRHEDSDLRGKGLDLPLIIRDYNLIKWIGANAYRTSHYPYAEEIMDLADEYGIMIIDECPAVNTEYFLEPLLAKHKTSITELVKRDKNRPSVILWSVSNEPRTQYQQAKEYFKSVIEHLKSLDQTRPVTIVEAQSSTVVQSSQYVDIISFNRYNGWYSNAGNLDVIPTNVITEARQWHQKFNKPVIMQEYGADTQEGLHILPDYIWSEEYQKTLMSQHFKAFDQLRTEKFFIGEFIWNFADFKTGQTYTRVGGNKKGVFTRNRQPKASAFLLRERYWSLAKAYNRNVTVPKDLQDYVISKHDEL